MAANMLKSPSSAVRFCPSPLRVFSYPGLGSGNPYLEQFYEAMQAHGVVHAGSLQFSCRWLDREAENIDVLHLHWAIENLWRRYLPPWAEPFKRLVGQRHLMRWLGTRPHRTGVDYLHKFLSEAREKGIRLVWTCHEVEPFEDVTEVDIRGYAVVAGFADLIVVASDWGKRELERRFGPRAEIVVSPIGNYDGYFPEPRSREVVRRQFGLDPGIPLVSCIGYVRHYKGADIACRAIELLKGKVQLLIAGAEKKFDSSGLRAQVECLPQVRWINRVLTDQEFSDIVHASDALLFPFRKATGSGSVVAGLTLRRGAIISDLPCFTEAYADCGDALVFFRSEDPQSLAAAIERFLRVPAEQRIAAAERVAESRSWPQVVLPIARVVQHWNHRPQDVGRRGQPG